MNASFLIVEGAGGVLEVKKKAGKRLADLHMSINGVHPVGDGRFAVFGSDGKVFVGKPTFKYAPDDWKLLDGLEHGVLDMAGDVKTGLYACGENGLLARLDKDKWTVIPTGLKTALNGIVVLARDRVMACGNGGVVGEFVNGKWSSTQAAKVGSPAGLVGGRDARMAT